MHQSDISVFSLDRPFHPPPSHLSSSLFSQTSPSTLRPHTMSSAPTSPTRPSPNDLQSHLYASFLQRKTADVALRISGSWHAVYKLHRVILIQAGFFQSLFTSGFSESNSKLSGHRIGQDYIDIVFDDPNITRAAFEICIARLYGGGPPLWISPSLIPTPAYPLTPSFASSPDLSASHPCSTLPPGLDISSSPALPSGHHPATPRFLLSLLATAVFLSIPSVASQALSAIVRTVGPYTAVRYLNFAIGHGIGPPADTGTEDKGVDRESEPAVGLEDVAELAKEEGESTSLYNSINLSTGANSESGRSGDTLATGSATSKDETCKHSHGCGGPPNSDSESDTDADDYHGARKGRSCEKPGSFIHAPCYYYGAVSDKVGEAATCWLSRWSVDILRHEEETIASKKLDEDMKDNDVRWSPAPHHVQWAGERPGSAPPEMAGVRTNGNVNVAGISGKPVVPIIWRRGGLSARWIRGILSSDAFFVRGEKERYETAKRVVEMRRAARIADDAEGLESFEEAEFERLFNEGIYYANMHLDDLMAISKDISPSTGKPVVPLAVLQASLWTQSSLYHRITYRPAGSASPSLSPTNAIKELGIGVSASDVGKLTLHPEDHGKVFYPIPSDSSLRLGDNTGLEGASMEQLFDPGSSKKGMSQATEANFFGLEQTRKPASTFTSPASLSPLSAVADAETKWTAYPPFRFAVEFWDVDALKEKSRLHSHTVWYAGSLYNVYVQVVRKKGVQLGIYLHRQSTIDPIPPSSAPASSTLPSPPRDRGILGRGSSSSVSSPRAPSIVSAVLPSGSGSMSPLARTSTTVSSPGTLMTTTPPMSASLSGTTPFARSSTTLHALTGSIGPVTVPVTAPPVMPPQPYRDPRPAVSAYFTIACASATGASLTRFTSAPDVFSVSQSWGWKSSSLRTEEYLEVDAEGQPASVVMPAGREVSLRATVVLGVV